MGRPIPVTVAPKGIKRVENMDKFDVFADFFGKTYYYKGAEVHYKSHGRIERDLNNLYNRYVQYSIAKKVTALISIDEANKWIAEHTPPDDKKDKIPASTWFKQWLKDNAAEWHISPAAKEILCTKFGVTTYKDADALRLAVMRTVYDNQLPYSEGESKTAIGTYLIDAYQIAIADTLKLIKYSPDYDAQARQWLKSVYDLLMPEQSFDIFITLMMHWAWQVKRKMLNLEVHNHIWPNFYGATGLGKTTLIRKMTKPLEDFTSTTNIGKLFDDTREIKRLTENFILNMDELGINCESEESGKISSDQKAILKSLLTGEKIDARTYGTQNQSKRNITFSCISSANQHLYDVVYDETSMRRFFEFVCTGTRPNDYTEINKYLDNSVAFWRGIDDSRDTGYWNPFSEIGQQITAIQQSYYPTKTTTKMWIDAVHVSVGRNNLECSYRAYVSWCHDTGNKCKNQQNFATDIRHLLPQAVNNAGRIGLGWSDTDADDLNDTNMYGSVDSFNGFDEF